jgi:resolvase-like protein
LITVRLGLASAFPEIGSHKTREPVQLVEAGAQFRSLAEAWADTSTSTGWLMLAMLGGLVDVERDLIRTRTAEGRSGARARGLVPARDQQVGNATNAQQSRTGATPVEPWAGLQPWQQARSDTAASQAAAGMGRIENARLLSNPPDFARSLQTESNSLSASPFLPRSLGASYLSLQFGRVLTA